jgi:hypothetical protein
MEGKKSYNEVSHTNLQALPDTLSSAVCKVTDQPVRRCLMQGVSSPQICLSTTKLGLLLSMDRAGESISSYIGRGRGSVHREKRVIQKTRYHITHITRQADTIATRRQCFGWKAFVTNATPERLSLQEVVLCYRNAYHVERIFNRLKSRVHIAPLFVKRNDHIAGLTYLLTRGVRVLTVMEFVVRRSLQTEQTKLPGVHPENKTKMTDKPTAERILKAFAAVSLAIIKHAAGEEILRRLTPLSEVQEDILQRLSE